MKDFLKGVVAVLAGKKVDYGDARVVETETESIVVRNGVVEGISRSRDLGFGVRVLHNGAWGFSSSAELAPRERDRVVRDALAISAATRSVAARPVALSARPAQKGRYRTPVVTDPFRVGLDAKIDLLLRADKALRGRPEIRVAAGSLHFVRMRKLFADTAGSWTEQEIVESGGGVGCYALKDGELQRRSYPCAAGGNFGQAGWEFVEAMALADHAEATRDEAIALLAAPVCPARETTLVIGTNQMVLQVHESCGHPTELDRVLGTEESYAGTSFLTPEKRGSFPYGSPRVTIWADATCPGGLGTFDFDDEGVPAQKVALVKDGIFANYLTSRETAVVIGQTSNGTMRADGWNRIPLIRMTNINLEPGPHTAEQLVGEVDDGIFVETNKSWSIDNKRLNFQFGTEIAWKIEHGRRTQVYKNPVYGGLTPQFWRSCDAVGDAASWMLWGVPNCGKGEPGQTAHVGHGTAPARFRSVSVGSVTG